MRPRDIKLTFLSKQTLAATGHKQTMQNLKCEGGETKQYGRTGTGGGGEQTVGGVGGRGGGGAAFV